MTDYKEEQQNELEALESIYPDELKVLETSPYAVFEISLVSQKHEDDEDEEEASCVLKFTYSATYPDEPPLMEVSEAENIDEEQQAEILSLMQSEAEENLGMGMVFTLVSAVQEQLTTLIEQSKQRRKDEILQRLREEEELEQKKFEGTRVTIENFLAWKAKFDAEMAELQKHQRKSDNNKKLSGKELFMLDASMIDSDVQFLQAEGEKVEVDESLFQDLDDLDIGEDDLDLEE
ncbi:RWD domain-containing protein 1-like [Mya arenaria]|uniref:RWD domain-containing protein 1-like n=1 Tax=Mya arenaria TaxID=6604 RepID=UPI0022E98F27|nr:RWD domain-containing protein 1-like [Mya arenaria]